MSTEFQKIETLFERDPKTFSVIPGEFKNPVYSLFKTWRWTEKIDGTNVRIIFTPSSLIGDLQEPIGSSAKIAIGGRTDNAVMPADLVQNILEIVTTEKMAASFQSPVILYGEGYGSGIQKNGAGYADKKKFILFDVFVDNKWWLNQEQVEDVGKKLGLDVVPFVGDWSLEEATEFVRAGFITRILGASPAKKAEGLVGRPVETLYDKNLHRIITKMKTKDFTGGKDI